MIRLAMSLLMASVVVTPAFAGDARLATREYNPEEVVRLHGQVGVQASVMFAEDEHIENVAVGDSTSWQITPNKRANLLFVKPMSPRARTNMTVVTDRRSYFFDLVAAPTAGPVYALRFTYPDEPKTALTSAPPSMLAAPATEESEALKSPPAEVPVDPATLNFAWRARGKAALLPSRVYDDGDSVYLSWPAKRQLPAIQVKDDKGVEGPINFAVRGEVIVIEGVPQLLVLRLGKEQATLENQGAPRHSASPPAALAAAAPAPLPSTPVKPTEGP